MITRNPPTKVSQTRSRQLMTGLREMMAQGSVTQDRLDSIVKLIASTMVADVASIYLRLESNELELVATEGLLPEAVHITRLNPREGLVGYIASSAQPLSVENAPEHPRFSYRPETGEDPFHSFLGVPILRASRVLGVICVQNQTLRRYDEDELETLQTIAMVLAEIIFMDNTLATDADEMRALALRPNRPTTIHGRILSEGLGIGNVYLHDPVVPVTKFFATDPDAEEVRLTKALEALRGSIDAILAKESSSLWGDPREVLETYRLLADDPGWVTQLMEGVHSGLSAEASIERTRREHRARFEKIPDSYMRERLHDLEDLDNRLLRLLAGKNLTSADDLIATDGSVLIARRLGPAEILEYRDAGLKAVLLEESGTNSHAAIVARALGMPALGGLGGLMRRVEVGDVIIVDAEKGHIHIRPDDQTRTGYENRIALRGQQKAEFARLRDEPAISKDGTKVELMLNAGLEIDMDHLDDSGADGVGLFRTEFKFLVSDTLPKLNEQISFYTKIMDAANGKIVRFRTLDLGADKIIPYMSWEREDNPALGWRSLRFALAHKGLFRRQMRGLIRAANGRPLSVMFPLITDIDEFCQARNLFLKEVQTNESQGYIIPCRVQIGAMLETPALAYMLPELAELADFVSIGTNDLMQYFFAADRDNPRTQERYDFLSSASLRFLLDIAEQSKRLDLDISVCGEVAGRPLEAVTLAAMGYRKLSMPASGIGPVKNIIRSVNLKMLAKDISRLIHEKPNSIRKEILNIIDKNNIYS